MTRAATSSKQTQEIKLAMELLLWASVIQLQALLGSKTIDGGSRASQLTLHGGGMRSKGGVLRLGRDERAPKDKCIWMHKGEFYDRGSGKRLVMLINVGNRKVLGGYCLYDSVGRRAKRRY